MPDEPSNGELGRGIDALRKDVREAMAGLNSRLDRVVGLDVYTIQSTHYEQRNVDLTRELQAARGDHKTLEDAFEAYKLAEAGRRERDRQARLYQMIVPVLIALLSAAVAIWAVTAS